MCPIAPPIAFLGVHENCHWHRVTGRHVDGHRIPEFALSATPSRSFSKLPTAMHARGTNRVGDKRGINGMRGQRGTNGRFVSIANPALQAGPVAPTVALEPGLLDGHGPHQALQAPQAPQPHQAQGRRRVRGPASPRVVQRTRHTQAQPSVVDRLPIATAIALAPAQPQADPEPLMPIVPLMAIAPIYQPFPPVPLSRDDSGVSACVTADSADTTDKTASAAATAPTETARTLTVGADTAIDDVPFELVDLVRMAAGPTLFQNHFVCSFDDLTDRAVLDAIEKREKKELPTARKATYFSFLVYQCAFDRRDQGGRLLPHVVVPNVMLPLDDLRVLDGDVTIEPIYSSDLATQAACAKIFVDRGLFKEETFDEVLTDMLTYTSEPFHFLAAKRDDVVVGGVVFRAHELNTRARLVTLELLATASNAVPGVGSALMRVMRELSQVTPRSIGFVAAACLKTAGARRFYHRKLPEVESPLARALMVSMSTRDPDSILKNHLELRCVTVMS